MKRNWLPQTICSIMLVGALFPGNPYEYYTLLRWVCCGVFLYLASNAYKQKQEGWTWIFGAIGLFYNPIFRVYLTREIWTIINIITAIIALASIFLLKDYKLKTNQSQSSKDAEIEEQ